MHRVERFLWNCHISVSRTICGMSTGQNRVSESSSKREHQGPKKGSPRLVVKNRPIRLMSARLEEIPHDRRCIILLFVRPWSMSE